MIRLISISMLAEKEAPVDPIICSGFLCLSSASWVWESCVSNGSGSIKADTSCYWVWFLKVSPWKANLVVAPDFSSLAFSVISILNLTLLEKPRMILFSCTELALSRNFFESAIEQLLEAATRDQGICYGSTWIRTTSSGA